METPIIDAISKDLSAEWWEMLDGALRRERTMRAIHEREFADKMDYDEFRCRAFHELELRRGNIGWEGAVESIDRYLKQRQLIKPIGSE